MSILVIDIGSSSLRAALVDDTGAVHAMHRRPIKTASPAPGFVQLDPLALASDVRDCVLEVLAEGARAETDPPVAIGITTQRATAVVWDRHTGEPVGPAIGWQDLRTVPLCLGLRAQGIELAPNESATKFALLADLSGRARSDLAVGTLDSWVAWTLSDGRLHVTDLSEAGTSGLLRSDGSGWNPDVLDALRLEEGMLPQIVDSSGIVGEASALPGGLPIAAIVGDQQASLIGQSCLRAGLAKATFGTGGMLDQNIGHTRASFPRRGPAGTFPIAAWRREGRVVWGVEAILLSAGSAIDWLWRDLGLAPTPAALDELAESAHHHLWFVPDLAGMGAPVWDFGARGALVGLDTDTTAADIARAALEGVAERGADLLDAAESDTGLAIDHLRVDGGLTQSQVFLQALADACQRPVEVSPVVEATTLGAAYLAGLAIGVWPDEDSLVALWRPTRVVEPGPPTDRELWRQVRTLAERSVPELSSLPF